MILDIATLCEANSSQKRSGMARIVKESQFYLQSTRLSMNGMNRRPAYLPASKMQQRNTKDFRTSGH